MIENLVNKLLIICEENQKKPHFNPFISIPGVNNPINTVNIPKTPLYFHSRHEIYVIKGAYYKQVVNNKKHPRRGLGSQS